MFCFWGCVLRNVALIAWVQSSCQDIGINSMFQQASQALGLSKANSFVNWRQSSYIVGGHFDSLVFKKPRGSWQYGLYCRAVLPVLILHQSLLLVKDVSMLQNWYFSIAFQAVDAYRTYSEIMSFSCCALTHGKPLEDPESRICGKIG